MTYFHIVFTASASVDTGFSNLKRIALLTFFTRTLLFTTTPTFANSVNPDQMASKPSDQDLHCLSFSL